MKRFADTVIAWQKKNGRHSLPWQNTRDAYRIWVSEIMLQQTQVSAVIGYYARFMARFPTLEALAAAPVDDVMAHWAGLGYYARARNLHKAAQHIMALHGGTFPSRFDEVLGLPGIGRSTAAAICAFAYGDRRAILDGNVKRVFARHFGFEGDPREKAVEDLMWLRAEAELPSEGIEPYTQGLMDLGATVCVRSRPTCLLCPVAATCVANQTGRTHELPHRRAKPRVPHRQTQMLVMLCQGEVLLERRPPTGIWGGLWSLPEVSVPDALHVLTDAATMARDRYGVRLLRGRQPRLLPPVEHGFTHYSLTIHPVEIAASTREARAAEPGTMWIDLDDIAGAALPAPVKKILLNLQNSSI